MLEGGSNEEFPLHGNPVISTFRWSKVRLGAGVCGTSYIHGYSHQAIEITFGVVLAQRPEFHFLFRGLTSTDVCCLFFSSCV